MSTPEQRAEWRENALRIKQQPSAYHGDADVLLALLADVERLEAEVERTKEPDGWYQDMANLLEERQAAEVKVMRLEAEIKTLEEEEHLARVGWAHEEKGYNHGRSRAAKAEAERDEAREERDFDRARADVLRARLGEMDAVDGLRPGDYWAAWHRDHCAAAEAATAAKAEVKRLHEGVEALTQSGVPPNGEPLPEWVHVDELRALLAGDS